MKSSRQQRVWGWNALTGFLGALAVVSTVCCGSDESTKASGPPRCTVAGQCQAGQYCVQGACAESPGDVNSLPVEGQSQVLFSDPMFFRDLDQYNSYYTQVSQDINHFPWFIHGSPRVTYHENKVTVALVTHPIYPFDTDRAKLANSVSKVVLVQNGAVLVHDVAGLVYGARWLRDGETYASVWLPGTAGKGALALVRVETGEVLVSIPVPDDGKGFAYPYTITYSPNDDAVFVDVLESPSGEAIALLGARSYFGVCDDQYCSPFTVGAAALRGQDSVWRPVDLKNLTTDGDLIVAFSSEQGELGIASMQSGATGGCELRAEYGPEPIELKAITGMTPWVLNDGIRAAIVHDKTNELGNHETFETVIEQFPQKSYSYVSASYESDNPVGCGLSGAAHNAGRALVRTNLGWVMPAFPNTAPPCDAHSAWGPVQFFAPHSQATDPERMVDEIDTCNDYGLNPLMGTWVSFTGDDITYVELWGDEQGQFRVRFHERLIK